MLAKRDYYKVLGVAPTATADEIRKAYRMLSKKYHPDLNPDMKIYSDEKMKELVEAYSVLNDNARRKEYDKQPQFQIRRARKDVKRKIDPAVYARKPQYQKEPSLLERLFSPFTKPKNAQNSEGTAHIDTKQADVHFTLGLSMSENESFYDQAINEFKLAVKFDSEHIEALYNLGIMCYRKGYFEEGIVNFQKVLARNKDDQHSRKMISLLREDLA